MRSAPVLARVLRGDRPESLHRGDVAVMDEEGSLLASAGSPRRPVYLRSAAKPFQAMTLLAAGGEAAFGLTDDDIALMCSSHGGEPRHTKAAARLLARGGFSVSSLACGAHPPMHEPSARALIARGERPSALHNNCSGKHAGLLLACAVQGLPAAGYCDPNHPVERQALAQVAQLCGVSASSVEIAVDGCSLPVFRLPLCALALGYARLMARSVPGESAARRRVRRRVPAAMVSSPGMVAGRDRFTTRFLESGRGAWIGKEGAEGVYAIGLAAKGGRGRAVGIAFKIEDGSTRARDAVALAILSALGRLPRAAARELAADRAPSVRNVAGAVVGRIEPTVPLAMRSAWSAAEAV